MSSPVPYNKEFTPTTSYAALLPSYTLFSGYITAKTTNTGTINLKDPAGNVTTLIATEYFYLPYFCDISQYQILSSDGTSVVKFQGQTNNN